MRSDEFVASIGLRADRRGGQALVHGEVEGRMTSRTVHVRFRPHDDVDVKMFGKGDEDMGLFPKSRIAKGKGGAQ